MKIVRACNADAGKVYKTQSGIVVQPKGFVTYGVDKYRELRILQAEATVEVMPDYPLTEADGDEALTIKEKINKVEKEANEERKLQTQEISGPVEVMPEPVKVVAPVVEKEVKHRVKGLEFKTHIMDRMIKEGKSDDEILIEVKKLYPGDEDTKTRRTLSVRKYKANLGG